MKQHRVRVVELILIGLAGVVLGATVLDASVWIAARMIGGREMFAIAVIAILIGGVSIVHVLLRFHAQGRQPGAPHTHRDRRPGERALSGRRVLVDRRVAEVHALATPRG